MQRARRAASACISGCSIACPGRVAPLGEASHQPHAWVIALSERRPTLSFLRPTNVPGSGAVARLAAHADLRKGGRVAIIRGVIIFSHAGRMALCAHEIPILVQLGPVQSVVVLDILVRIEMEPMLAALVLRAAIPGERQR